MAAVGTLAVHLRQWDRHVRDHRQHGSQLSNLAEALRADIRRATGVTQPEKNIVAIAAADGREIRYELQPDSCRRTVKSPGEKSPRIETFVVEARNSGAWAAASVHDIAQAVRFG
jgi:hypothetical protein